MTEQLELQERAPQERAEGTEAASDGGEARSPSLGGVIGRLAHAMSREGPLGAGEVAELRRLEPHDPGSPAFWKVVAAYLEDSLPSGGERLDDAERRWAAILSGLATLGPLHRQGVRLGLALAEAGLSELRFVRLLRAHDEGLLHQARVTAKFLSAKGQPADWTGMARLVLSDGRDDEERVRRQLAREYYGHLKR